MPNRALPCLDMQVATVVDVAEVVHRDCASFFAEISSVTLAPKGKSFIQPVYHGQPLAICLRNPP